MRPPALILIAVFAVNAAILRFLGVGLGFQLGCAGVLGVLTLGGVAFSRPVERAFDDATAQLAAGFLVGVSVFAALNFALFHRGVSSALGIDSLVTSSRIALAIVAIPALWTLLKCIREGPRWLGRFRSRPAVVVAATLAVGVSACTIYGAFNNTHSVPTRRAIRFIHLPKDHPVRESDVPDWGWQADSYNHFVYHPSRIYRSGFPEDRLVHRGVQMITMGTVLVFADFHEANLVSVAKLISALLWIAMLYFAYVSARRVFALRRGPSLLVMVSFVLLAPINVPLLTVDRSSYSGLISASGPFAHNITQLYSVSAGLAGIVLIAATLKGRVNGWGFASGCLLVGASFLFKPSLYSVAAPAVCLAYVLSPDRLHPGKWIGLGVLFAPAILWVSYPLFAEVRPTISEFEFLPFKYLFRTARDRFPGWITSSSALFITSILLVSFSAFVIPLLLGLWRFVRALGTSVRWSGYRAHLFVSTIFVLGMISGLFFNETGPRLSHGNFLWAAAAGYLVALPLFFRAIVASPRWVRISSWVLLGLQLGNGALHLFLSVTTGRIT